MLDLTGLWGESAACVLRVAPADFDPGTRF